MVSPTEFAGFANPSNFPGASTLRFRLRPSLIIPSCVPLWWLNFEIHIQFDASRGGNSERCTRFTSQSQLRVAMPTENVCVA
jgi:hypothetical protein